MVLTSSLNTDPLWKKMERGSLLIGAGPEAMYSVNAVVMWWVRTLSLSSWSAVPKAGCQPCFPAFGVWTQPVLFSAYAVRASCGVRSRLHERLLEKHFPTLKVFMSQAFHKWFAWRVLSVISGGEKWSSLSEHIDGMKTSCFVISTCDF